MLVASVNPLATSAARNDIVIDVGPVPVSTAVVGVFATEVGLEEDFAGALQARRVLPRVKARMPAIARNASPAVDRQVLVGVANSAVKGQLDKWIESNRRAGISNMLIVAIDEELPVWLASKGVACWARPDKALGSHMISAQKFKFVKSFLSVGASVLMSDIDVVYLRNPFRFLWGDADIEGTTDGWDDGSAYG